MKASRQIVYDALMKVWYEGGYSNIVLDQAIQQNKLDKTQAGFVSALFYGVLETAIQLDYILRDYLTSSSQKKLDKEVLVILRMGLYQLLYLDSVPDNAAVDESVRLAAYARKTSAKGFVNAVLRAFLRGRKGLPEAGGPSRAGIVWPDREKDELLYLSIRYACPQWILRQWREQYGVEIAEQLAKSSLGRPPLTVRVNPLKTTPEKLIGYLENRGVTAYPHEWLENCLVLSETGGIDRLPQYRQGLFHVQDASSQLSALALGAQPGETVLDICAAPGSKSFTVAEEMNNEGHILSFDLHEQKLRLIAQGAKRLGLTIIDPAVQDGRSFNPELPSADRVLCDVPCSGLGVIRRKPEIKYQPETEREGLPALQLEILRNASRYVKPGGRLVYSTCTTNRAENEEVAKAFLSQNISFIPLQSSQIFSKINFMGQLESIGVTLFPHLAGGDGFYIAAFARKTE